MTQTSNIETNRLVLRPFSESDALMFLRAVRIQT